MTTTTKKPVAKKPAAAKKVTSAKAAVAKKPVAKTVAKAAPVKKAVKKEKAAPEPIHVKAIHDTLNRTQLVAHMMEKMESHDLAVSKKQATTFLKELGETMQASIVKKGSGVFTFPGLFRIFVKDIPAKKMPAIAKGTMVRKPGQADLVAHEGRAAFTKPASRRVKIRPMKGLKIAAIS